MREFENKHVVITGGASGIGKGMVEAFAAEGAKIIFADINSELGNKTCKEVSEINKNNNIEFIKVNLSNADEIDYFVKSVLKKMEYIDVLINNVGANIKSGSVLEHSIEDFYKTMDLNVISYIHCIKSFLPSMIERKSGSIINITSTMAFGAKGFSAYSISKGSIITLTKTLALDHASDNVRINAIAPGFIDTPATQEYIQSEPDPAKAKGVPMGKVGKIKDIANAALFLASQKASYITGHVLVVDGGLTVGE